MAYGARRLHRISLCRERENRYREITASARWLQWGFARRSVIDICRRPMKRQKMAERIDRRVKFATTPGSTS
jgi:hypothetical protein